MTPDSFLERPITRRGMVGMMGAAGVALIVGCDADGDTPTAESGATATRLATGTDTLVPDQLSCMVSPKQAEGPFFVDEMLERRDIREGLEGALLELNIRVFGVEGGSCTPLQRALVEVWHCDAAGRYSGVEVNDTEGESFLRGFQRADEDGAVTFTTIYPGWYQGRTPHVHVKVRTEPDTDLGTEFTSQIYFDDDVSDEVFAQTPYNTRGERDRRNGDDNLFMNDGAELIMTTTPFGEGYAGRFDIGVVTG